MRAPSAAEHNTGTLLTSSLGRQLLLVVLIVPGLGYCLSSLKKRQHSLASAALVLDVAIQVVRCFHEGDDAGRELPCHRLDLLWIVYAPCSSVLLSFVQTDFIRFITKKASCIGAENEQ